MGPPPFDAASLDLKLDPLRRELRALRTAVRSGDRTDSHRELRQEIGSLRDMISSMWTQREVNEVNDPLFDILQAADVEPAFARELADQVHSQENKAPIRDSRTALEENIEALKATITNLIRVDDSFFERPGPRRVALVGPTGVGKTVTLAKIADAALAHNKKVALVGTDAYRIAAFEQLSHFAQLLDVPLALARDPESFTNALRSFQDHDLVLIDTAGRSPNDENFIPELRELFEGQRVQCYLTLSATTRALELPTITNMFAPLNPHALIFTKLDETQALGAVLNGVMRCDKPVAFLSIGQEVPGDLAMADASELAERTVGMVLESTDFAWLNKGQQDENPLLWAAQGQGDANAH